MRYFKTIATAAAVLSFCTACAASEPAMQTKAAAAAAHTDVKTGHHNATVKPGAALQFAHSVEGTLSVGAYSDVALTVIHDYDAGALTLEASGSDSLDILSSTARMSAPLSSSQAPVQWTVAVRPTHDGVHYLNLRGQVTDAATGLSSTRVHAVRLDLGGKTVDVSSAKSEVVMQGDQPVAVFDAVETIRDTDG